MKEGSMLRSNWKRIFGSNGTPLVWESGVVFRSTGGWVFLPLLQDGPRMASNPRRARGRTDRRADGMETSRRTDCEVYRALRSLSRLKPPFRRGKWRILPGGG